MNVNHYIVTTSHIAEVCIIHETSTLYSCCNLTGEHSPYREYLEAEKIGMALKSAAWRAGRV